MPTRRETLAGLVALATPEIALADDDGFDYRDHRVDITAAPAGKRRALVPSIRRQLDIVEDLPISAEALAFFRSISIGVDPSLHEPGVYRGSQQVFIIDRPQPENNPVLLHELLHAYHHLVLPQSNRNPDVLKFYQRAKTVSAWPKDAYMLSNVGEFFAMTVSVVLFGQAARPPSTRAAVKENQPIYFDWIVRQFGLRL